MFGPRNAHCTEGVSACVSVRPRRSTEHAGNHIRLRTLFHPSKRGGCLCSYAAKTIHAHHTIVSSSDSADRIKESPGSLHGVPARAVRAHWHGTQVFCSGAAIVGQPSEKLGGRIYAPWPRLGCHPRCFGGPYFFLSAVPRQPARAHLLGPKIGPHGAKGHSNLHHQATRNVSTSNGSTSCAM